MAVIIQNNRIVTFTLPTRAYTKNEQDLLNRLKAQTPISYLKNVNETNDLDLRLLSLSQSAIDDFNLAMPTTNYTVATLPAQFYSVIIMGTQIWLMMFQEMRFSLIDLTYSDSGLSIAVNRVDKISAVMKNYEERYMNMLNNAKRGIMMSNGGAVLISPRFQGNLSRMIGMLGSGAMGWNVP